MLALNAHIKKQNKNPTFLKDPYVVVFLLLVFWGSGLILRTLNSTFNRFVTITLLIKIFDDY